MRICADCASLPLLQRIVVNSQSENAGNAQTLSKLVDAFDVHGESVLLVEHAHRGDAHVVLPGSVERQPNPASKEKTDLHK